MRIALDGPSGAGKSTVAKALAKELGIIYVDTGALYRTVGLYVKNKGLEKTDTPAIISCLEEINLGMEFVNGEQIITLNGEKIGQEIRTGEIAMYASSVSAIPEVRSFLLETQRKIARENDVVMDGRDIGTVIIPDAEVKIFMVASAEARAKRRFLELQAKGENCTFEGVLADIIERDTNDSTRKTAPAIPAKDAIHLDNSNYTIEETVAKVVEIINSKQKKTKKKKNKFYKVIKFLFKWFFKLIYRVKIKNKEKEPLDKNFIVCCNHTALMDVAVIILSLKNQIRFMAKKEVINAPVAGWFIKGMGAFPVDRKAKDVGAIKKTIKILDEGSCVGIFPQGTRHPYENPRETAVKDGIGMVALRANVGILPVAIRTKKSKLKLFRRTEFVIGDYIEPSELQFEAETIKEKYQKATEYAFSKVCDLLEDEGAQK